MKTYTYDGDGARESEDAPTMSSRGGFAYTQGGALVEGELPEGADDHLKEIAFNLRGREGGAQPEADPDGLASLRAAPGGSSRSYVTATGEIAHSLTSEGHDAGEDGTGRGTPIVAGGITRRYGKGTDSDMTDTSVVEPSSFNWQSGGDVRHDVREGETGALHVGQTPAVHGAIDEPGGAVPFDPRPDGPRYAAMGDAVTTSVAYWVGCRIMGVHLGLDPDELPFLADRAAAGFPSVRDMWEAARAEEEG